MKLQYQRLQFFIGTQPRSLTSVWSVAAFALLTAEMSGCSGDCRAQKAYDPYCLALYGQSLLTLACSKSVIASLAMFRLLTFIK